MKKILLPLLGLLSLGASNFDQLSIVPVVSDCVTAEATTFEVSSDDPEFVLPETINQTVLSRKLQGKTATITIHTGTNSAYSPVPERSLTGSSTLLKLSDPSVKEAAKPLFNSKNPLLDAECLVYNIIKEKTMGIPMLNARDIIKMKAGDCTEHAVLSAALLREIGIPTIGVIGMYYTDEFGKYKQVFVYHMWCEAYFNGKWQIVDATRPFDKHPNRYIALTYHDLSAPIPLDVIGKLQEVKNLRVKAHR